MLRHIYTDIQKFRLSKFFFFFFLAGVDISISNKCCSCLVIIKY